MKSNKDRNIRVNNLNNRNIKYQLKSFNWRIVFIVFMLIIVVLISIYNSVIAISTFVISLFYLRNIKSILILELTDKDLVYYFNEEEAIIIYYKEIINYQIENNDNVIKVSFLLDNEDILVFNFYDKKVVSMLEDMIGDKYVEK